LLKRTPEKFNTSSARLKRL
jgi:hypothetical protein